MLIDPDHECTKNESAVCISLCQQGNLTMLNVQMKALVFVALSASSVLGHLTMLNVQMKALVFVVLSASSVLGTSIPDHSDTALRGSHVNTSQTPLICRIVEEHIFFNIVDNIFAKGRDEVPVSYDCYPVQEGVESDKSYQIDLSPALIEQYAKEMSNGLYLLVPGGRAVGGSIEFPSEVGMEAVAAPLGAPLRRLNAQQNKTVLVIRVSSLEARPVFTGPRLYDFFFNDESVSVRRQYLQCSFGQLELQPSVAGGLLDVNVDVYASFSSQQKIVQAATDVARTKLGITGIHEAADFVIFCLPPGTGQWVGSAGVNHWRSVFNNKHCGHLSVVMHELG
jgi:hypothetical protein